MSDTLFAPFVIAVFVCAVALKCLTGELINSHLTMMLVSNYTQKDGGYGRCKLLLLMNIPKLLDSDVQISENDALFLSLTIFQTEEAMAWDVSST